MPPYFTIAKYTRNTNLTSALRLVILSAVFIFLGAACSSKEQTVVELTDSPPTTQPTKPPPVIVKNVTTQNSQPEPAAATVDSLISETTSQAGDQNQESVSTGSQATLVTASPTPEPSPVATFTPPASPEPSPAEHYWLHRPVPDGDGVWTDKAYPYGSNRGGTLRTHHGVEFNVPAGTEVLAAADGTVVTAGTDTIELFGPENDFYGNVVVVQHNFGLNGQPIFTLYGHLSEILVSVGQQVRAQDLIAYSGATGVADGAHLHFEVRQGENNYSMTRSPLLWLYPFPDRGVVAGRIVSTEGQLVAGYPLTLRRIDAASSYAGTTSYADGSVNPDDNWQENFAFDDVVAGYYEITVGSGEAKETIEFWVYPYLTTFVELTLAG